MFTVVGCLEILAKARINIALRTRKHVLRGYPLSGFNETTIGVDYKVWTVLAG
jgi:hypothetical protein